MKKLSFISLLGMCFLFSIALHAQVESKMSPEELSVYQQHPNEVKSMAFLAAGDELAGYLWKYRLKKGVADTLYAKILDKETRAATYNYIYFNNYLSRYTAKEKVRKEYQDAINRDLLKAGVSVSTNGYVLALRCSKILSFTSAQEDSIIACALQINKLKKLTEEDTWLIELKNFKNILNEKQLHDLLSQKNLTKSVNERDGCWKQAQEYGLTEGQDSVAVGNKLFSFFLNRNIAADYNEDNQKLRKEAIAEINNNAPLFYRQVKLFRSNKSTRKDFRGTFIW